MPEKDNGTDLEVGNSLHVGGRDFLVDDRQITSECGQPALQTVTYRTVEKLQTFHS